MYYRLSAKTKEQRKMGQGEGANYKPYSRVKEFNSSGTTSNIADWKHGRSIECFSQGEMLYYYILRWDDNNVDIREQFPLDIEITRKLADKLGIRYPGDGQHKMTTDFLVTRADGTYHAYAVKPSRELSDRTVEKLYLEKLYWKYEGIGFTVLYKSDVNKIFAHNIRLVVEFYDFNKVFDRYSLIKHLIATKQISVDMTSKILEREDLEKFYYQLKGAV